MISLRADRLADLVSGTVATGDGTRQFAGVSTDSRTVKPGELFIAIRGEKHDGHRFLTQAAQRGAAAVLVDNEYAQLVSGAFPDNVVVVAVPDTHEGMIALAHAYLRTLEVTRIGITGSNGKTTTKEFAYRLLKAISGNVYRSPGNFNNLFGIPLSLFAMPQTTRLAVLEMGISTPGEMARLAQIVQPDIVAVTNVSPTHLEFLGTVEAVAREKLELHKHAAPDAPLVINADDDLLMREAKAVTDRIVTFGVKNDADFKPESIECTEIGSAVTINGDRFEIPLFGDYQVYNLLAAYAVIRTLGYDFSRVDIEAIDLVTAPMRGEVIHVRGVTIVADCYNANPESVRAGLQSFNDQANRECAAGGRRIVVLGDMLELGESEVEYHQAVGRQLAGMKLDMAVLVGPLSKYAAEQAVASGMNAGSVRHMNSADECAAMLAGELHEEDTVYLKGSRGVGLEAVIRRWQGEEKA